MVTRSSCILVVIKVIRRMVRSSSINSSRNFQVARVSNKLLPQGPQSNRKFFFKLGQDMKVESICSFSRFLEVSGDGAEVTSTGRSFHVRALATRNARRPIVGSLTAGKSRSSVEEDRSLCRDGMSAIRVNCAGKSNY